MRYSRTTFQFRQNPILFLVKHFYAKVDNYQFTVAAAYTADNLCTKQGNVGLKSAAYKQERLMMTRVRYFELCIDFNTLTGREKDTFLTWLFFRFLQLHASYLRD